MSDNSLNPFLQQEPLSDVVWYGIPIHTRPVLEKPKQKYRKDHYFSVYCFSRFYIRYGYGKIYTFN